MSIQRILIAAAIVIGTYLWADRQRPSELVMPDPPLAEFPIELGQFTGEEVEIDERTLEVIDADEFIARRYENEGGQAVIVYLSAFKDYFRGLMHHPMSCYPAGGWRFQEEVPTEVTLADGRQFDVRILRFEQDEQTISVLYWYQLGDVPVFSREQFGVANVSLGGSRVRPALLKVIVQTPGNDEEAAQQLLSEFTARVLPWTLAACADT